VGFGKLRVLNDDIIEPAMGFGLHPHDNMEIITIMLRGKLQHTDSMGHVEIIKPFEVQVMSAGKGLMHSELNASDTEQVHLFQLWIIPDKQNVSPRYDQKVFDPKNRINNFDLLVGPYESGSPLWIYQKAWIKIAHIEASHSINYIPNQIGNKLYFMTIQGELEINGKKLEHRDAAQISNTDDIHLKSVTNSEVLVIETE
jgi:redox-sensitive bicupin YhaK (pirin superfamily)